MAEIEKQENQKTVVAFIAGLLIGGLLVWIFSSTPDTREATNDESAEEEDENSNVSKEDVSPVATNTNSNAGAQVTTGSGSITIADQKAGKSVALGTVRYPSTSGWIVIRDYMDGVPGNILGAARYNTEEGLVPTSIVLVRETVADNSYQASFFTNEGAIGFNLGEDKPVEGVTTSFEATN